MDDETKQARREGLETLNELRRYEILKAVMAGLCYDTSQADIVERIAHVERESARKTGEFLAQMDAIQHAADKVRRPPRATLSLVSHDKGRLQ